MDILKTGIGLTKTFKNAQRLKEVATIFARHGFSEFIAGPIRPHLPGFVLPKSQKSITPELSDKNNREWAEVIGIRLRLVFEELGPAAIKLGQLLSTREDIFEPPFIEQMKKLQDKVRSVEFELVKKSLESSYGMALENIFSDFQQEPLGTASIGIVYPATLKKENRQVVVKVKRPGIDRDIESDFSILLFIIKQVEKVSEEFKYLGLSRVIEDFASGLQAELNFYTEALNAQRLKSNLEKHDENSIFYVPQVYSEYCTRDVLVMERLEGVAFSRKQEILPLKDELRPKLEQGIQLFFKTFLQDGFFHADLHGGNLFYLENKKIGLIDFGLMGAMGKSSRKSFIAIIYSLVSFNYENLVYEFLDVAEYEKIPDVEVLVGEVRAILSPYVGLTVQQIDVSDILQKIITVLRRHHLYLPKDWYIVFRALMTLDGVGKNLEMDFDIYGIMEKDIQGLLKDSFSKDELIEEGIWLGRDLLSSFRMMPRHIRWFTKDFAKRGYALELNLKGHESSFIILVGGLKFLALSLMSAVFTLCGVIVLGEKTIGQWNEIPVLTWVFWSLAMAFLYKGFKSVKKID